MEPKIEELLRQGTELFQVKRFKEAGLKFYEALKREPHRVDIAYRFSLSLYFSGAYHEALQLFAQLLNVREALEAKQVQGLQELSLYALWECKRNEYWEGLKCNNPKNLEKELKKRHQNPASLKAFHLFYINGEMQKWIQEYKYAGVSVDVRFTDRNGNIRLYRNCSDADSTIGTHLEAVVGSAYTFIPMADIQIVKVGPLKRWIKAEIIYRNGESEMVQVPLLYRDSSQESARGVREGSETIIKPMEGLSEYVRAFGQKQFRSGEQVMPISKVFQIEVLST